VVESKIQLLGLILLLLNRSSKLLQVSSNIPYYKSIDSNKNKMQLFKAIAYRLKG